MCETRFLDMHFANFVALSRPNPASLPIRDLDSVDAHSFFLRILGAFRLRRFLSRCRRTSALANFDVRKKFVNADAKRRLDQRSGNRHVVDGSTLSRFAKQRTFRKRVVFGEIEIAISRCSTSNRLDSTPLIHDCCSLMQ